MKPMYASLLSGYPPHGTVPPAALFAEIGWQAPAARTPDTDADADADTCAVRVSLALVRAGARIPGRVNVSSGRFKGQRIEAAQTRLSLLLTHASLLGRPEVYHDGEQAQERIGQRRGIVSYWCRDPAQGQRGHIDIVGPDAAERLGCGAPCYRNAAEVWFWPLK